MNPKVVFALFSFRKELLTLALLFLFVIFVMPIIVVAVLTQTGIQAVSDALVQSIPGSSVVRLVLNNKKLEGPFYWPVRSSRVSLEFGKVDLPFQPLHTGIDIAGAKGDLVRPFMPGRVVYIGNLNWGYGKHVVIDHGNDVTAIYAHLDKINVNLGDEVGVDEVIGTRGSTGWSTGPHLHFEIRVSTIPVNPREFLGDDRL